MLIRDASELPEGIGQAALVGLDLETYDPHLKTLGPGDRRGDGHVAGVAVSAEDGPSVYVPVGHETGPCVDREPVARWLKTELGGRKYPIVGANINYDRGWLEADLGVDLVGIPAHDVQVAEPLIDETKDSYSLDATARDYVDADGKPDQPLYDLLAEQCGGRATRRQQGGNIWRAPADSAELYDYVMADIDLPLHIIRRQYAELRRLGLIDAFRRETVVLDIVLLMRRRGVAVDLDKAERVKEQLTGEIDTIRGRLGVESVWAPQELDALCRHHGHTPGKTATKQPSITKSFLAKIEQDGEDWAADLLRARKLSHALNTFVQSYVLDFVAPDGRIHGQFHQLRGNDDEDRGMQGAITGRFSSSTPNLQNIPSRDPEMGPLVRGLFVPDDDEDWVSHDYEQIEPRLTLHYASGAAAEDERAAYHDDPARDCYRTMIEALQDEPALAGFKEVRKPVKNVWLGLLYGMGKDKLCNVYLNVDRERGDEIVRVFNEAAPYVDALKRSVQQAAKRRGWLRTIGGRRANFPLWEPADFETKFERSDDGAQRFPPQRDPVTVRQWLGEAGRPTRVTRAWAHKALNKLIQGGAADLMKAAMVAQYEAGVYDTLGPPLVTVHDELDWSVPCTREGRQAVEYARRLMAEPGIELNIPLLVGEERGPDWGHVEEVQT